MKIFKAVLTVGSFTVVSRLLGLARDMMLAAILGVGPVSDAFFIAFKLPNFFRRLFAEGALNAAFVPIFSRLYTASGIDVARRTAEQVFSVLLAALIIFVISMEIGMPWLMHIIAPGFTDNPDKIQLTIFLSRITFPYILFISIVAFYSGILNSINKFTAAALSPVILNIAIIIGLVIIQYKDASADFIWILAASVTAGGVIQHIWLRQISNQLIGPLKLSRPRLTPDVKRLLHAMAPGALGAGIMQINLFIDTILASLLPAGAVSYLYYADRLNQLPLSLLGIGISTVLLPVLAKHFEKDQHHDALQIQKQALEFTFALTLPAAVGLSLLGVPILTLLFQHKHFNAHDVSETAKVLSAFLTGLPAYVATKILTTSFFARYDTKTPVKMAVIAMIVNVGLNICLMGPYQYVGIALGTSITAWLNMFMLGFRLHKKGFLNIDKYLIIKCIKILMAVLIMGWAIHITYTCISNHFPLSFFYSMIQLFICIVVGIITYVLSIFLTKTFSVNDLQKIIKR